MKIILASDHAGFELKNKIKDFLVAEGFGVEDLGASVLDPEDDYPKYMVPAAMRVVNDPENTKAIIFGKSGQGEAMVSNRFPGVRAAVYYSHNLEIIRLSREHNDANVLSIGAGLITEEQAIEAVKTWIATPFSGDPRHIRRNEMIDNIQ